MFLLLPSKQNMFPTLPKAIGLCIDVCTSGHCSTKPMPGLAISNCKGANFFQGGDSVFGGKAHHDPQGSCGGPCWPTIFEAETYSTANCAIDHGTKIGENASLSHSEKLKQLLKARNEKFGGEPEPDQEELFEEKPRPGTSTKRKAAAMETTNVVLEVGGTNINCLMVGSRPTRSDLTIGLQPDQIQAIVNHLRATSTSDLEIPTRA